MPLYLEFPSWLDPYVVSFLPIRWYAVMYVVAFAIAYALYAYQLGQDKGGDIDADTSQTLFIVAVIGLLVGARLFSVLFYSDASYYLTHPWMIFWPFRNGRFVGLPGMSYHGGVVGAVVAGWIYARRKGFYGRVSSVPWAMVFPDAPSFSTCEEWVRRMADHHGIAYSIGDMVNLPRHPSQLYEALFEGVVLFLILWFICRPLMHGHALKPGSMLSFYMFGYGFFRFFIEYCRQPDADIGYVITLGGGGDEIALFQSFGNISKGQVFCLVMMVAAIILFAVVNRRSRRCTMR